MINQDLVLDILERKVHGWNEEKHCEQYWNGNRIQEIQQFYHRRTGQILDLENAVTFNEKLQWLKAYWRNPLAKRCADKLQAKEILKEIGLAQLIIPTLGSWKYAEEVDFSALPDCFVVKTNHASGFNLIVQNKNTLDMSRFRRVFGEILQRHPYTLTYEWVYEEIRPIIYCEPLLEVVPDVPLDYKFYCFHGRVEYVHILTVVEGEDKADPECFFTDREYRPLNVEYGYKNKEQLPPRHPLFEKMVAYAQQLSKPFPHVRIDFMVSQGKIYFGEYTFFSGSGCDEFRPAEFDEIMGKKLVLPAKEKS